MCGLQGVSLAVLAAKPAASHTCPGLPAMLSLFTLDLDDAAASPHIVQTFTDDEASSMSSLLPHGLITPPFLHKRILPLGLLLETGYLMTAMS